MAMAISVMAGGLDHFQGAGKHPGKGERNLYHKL